VAEELGLDHAEIQRIEPASQPERRGLDEQDDRQQARGDRGQRHDQQQLHQYGARRFAGAVAGDVEKGLHPAALLGIHRHEEQLVGAAEDRRPEQRFGGAKRRDDRPALEKECERACDPDASRQRPNRAADTETVERAARVRL